MAVVKTGAKSESWPSTPTRKTLVDYVFEQAQWHISEIDPQWQLEICS